MNDAILATYLIDANSLIDEAYYLTDNTNVNEDKLERVIEQMVSDAAAPSKVYHGNITEFTAWLTNSNYDETISQAIWAAITDWVSSYLNDHLNEKED